MSASILNRRVELIRIFRLCAWTLCIVLLVAGDSLLGQGCSMCKTSLEGQTDSVVNALKVGVLVMLLPAVTIVAAIILALRDSEKSEDSSAARRPGPLL